MGNIAFKFCLSVKMQPKVCVKRRKGCSSVFLVFFFFFFGGGGRTLPSTPFQPPPPKKKKKERRKRALTHSNYFFVWLFNEVCVWLCHAFSICKANLMIIIVCCMLVGFHSFLCSRQWTGHKEPFIRRSVGICVCLSIWNCACTCILVCLYVSCECACC